MASADHISTSNCEPIVAALHAAWRQVQRVSVRSVLHERPGCDRFCNELGIDLSVTALEADLVALGLATQDEIDAIPAGGHYSRGQYSLKRGRRGTRLRVFVIDPDPFGRDLPVQRVWDAVVRTLAPSVWTPPKREAA